jgi:hypothetical protein
LRVEVKVQGLSYEEVEKLTLLMSAARCLRFDTGQQEYTDDGCILETISAHKVLL